MSSRTRAPGIEKYSCALRRIDPRASQCSNGRMKIKCAYDRLINVADLKPHPKNRNRHPKAQLERLAAIMAYQGIRKPIRVSNLSGLMTAGHGTLEAAKLNGWKAFPVNFQDYDDEAQEIADLNADNAIALWAEIDMSGVNADIGDLGPDFNIDMLGIEGFTVDVAERDDRQDDVPEPPKKAKTQIGDIYQLGEHRLLCGDSTSAKDVERLMRDELADLWLTDPPYGVSYQSNGAEKKHEKIVNDNLPMEEMGEFWTKVAKNAYDFCANKSAYYWFACQGGDQMMMMMSISNANWKVRHELIWVKDSLVLGRCDYHYKHEPILYGWKKDGTHLWTSDRKQTSVLEFARPKRSDDHPTMKPVELVAYLMKNNTEPNQIVLDTFGGSGTTLIAAEKVCRKARLIEISPVYCDVIVRRWEEFAGKEAVLLTPRTKKRSK